MFRALAFALLAGLVTPSFAADKALTQQQLDAAAADIATLKKMLDSLQQEKSGVQQQLRHSESEMGQLEQQVKQLQNELRDGERELQQLDQEKKKLQQSRLEQQRLIAVQARAAYQSGQQEPLRLLLNQQRPEQFSRTLTYYDHLGQARIRQLDGFNETLRQLANVETAIASQHLNLQDQKRRLDSQLAALAETRKQRQQALAQLNRQHGDQARKLKSRQQDQAQLARVLKTIEETLARQAREAAEARRLAALQTAQQRQSDSSGQPRNLPLGPSVATGATVGGPFAQARGKLPWPVNGRLAARYGSPRGDDPRARWDGVLISASIGSPVQAVHGGRVVFADWLRGAGLLVILDHGNGYLSLYGHNQSLLKKPGEQVKAGDPIATVGNSGGQASPALYFAIRQQGRASDPAQWCRTQG
ncbi:TPA: murein hydrolase activator EnvC [Klebsiella pneumoniae]